MQTNDIQLLEAAGWVVECLSPLEIRHEDSNSFATNLAANYVLDGVRSSPNDEDATPGSSDEVELEDLVTKVLEWTRHAETVDTEETWDKVYHLVFSKNVSIAIGSIRQKMGVALDYYDPNTSYKEDVQAYANALRNMAIGLKPFYKAFEEFQ